MNKHIRHNKIMSIRENMLRLTMGRKKREIFFKEEDKPSTYPKLGEDDTGIIIGFIFPSDEYNSDAYWICRPNYSELTRLLKLDDTIFDDKDIQNLYDFMYEYSSKVHNRAIDLIKNALIENISGLIDKHCDKDGEWTLEAEPYNI